MQSLDLEVIQRACAWIREYPIWLCTVLSTYGSSPRSPGAMMVVNNQGNFVGSLSGGCIEEDFLSRLSEGFYRQSSQVIRYGDGGLTPNVALPCGGILDVLVEYLIPDEKENTTYLEMMASAMRDGQSLCKKITIPYHCSDLHPTDYRSNTDVEYEKNSIKMIVAAPPRIIIAGLSVVAIFCSEYALSLGFETIICENRPDVLDNFSKSINKNAILMREFPANYLEREGCHSNTAIVALTHDPRMDDLTLMEAVNTDAFYLGAMGSDLNSSNRLSRLKKIAGLNDDEISRIHAPIGLQIGSKTPSEIALSVMADIVAVKNHRRL